MAATLTSCHYVRSTNQWSDPATQVWLYDHDAEMATRRYLEREVRLPRPEGWKELSDWDELVEAGLVARGE